MSSLTPIFMSVKRPYSNLYDKFDRNFSSFISTTMIVKGPHSKLLEKFHKKSQLTPWFLWVSDIIDGP